VNRKHLPEAVGYIKRRLLADWSDINFIIGSNPDDYIELRFEQNIDDAPVGLKAYMNVLVDQDEELTKYQLRKVGEFWGVNSQKSSRKKGDRYIYFMMAPPWVHKREPTLYLMQLNNSE
jgi:hypothetical protein